MTTAATIRPVRSGDFPSIAALNNIFIEQTAVHFGYSPVTPAELEESWLKSASLYPYLVAEIDGGFAGFAKSGRWRERDAYAWTAEVGIYIQPEFHRRGIGRSLYAALIEACRRRGFHSLIGGITLPNQGSVSLHQSMGFQPAGTFRRVGWKFNQWHDVAFYQLMLTPPETPAPKL